MNKLFAILCVLALLLAACGGSEGESPSPAPLPTAAATTPPEVAEQEAVTIRFAVYDWESANYLDLIKAFEEENPGIKVEIVSSNEILGISLTDTEVPDDAERRLASAADVVAAEASAGAVKEGLARDLTPFIEADPDFEEDDFYPNSLESYRWDGGTWSLPTSLNFQVIFFDKAAFDQADVAYPEPGWTWDDFLSRASALTAREGDEVSRWGFVAGAMNHRLLIESQTGELIDESTEPATPLFDRPEVADAVRWYTNLYLKEQVMPYLEPAGEGALVAPDQALIDNRQAGMWVESDIVWWWRNQQGPVGILPFPGGAADGSTGLTPVWTSGLAMSAGTAQPEAAWSFMDYVSRQYVATYGPGMTAMPARRSLAESSGYWDKLDEGVAATLRYAVDHGRVRPLTSTGYEAFNDALEAIFSGEKPVEQALADAQEQAEGEIQEALAAESGATPAPTIVVAPAEEKTPVAAGAVTITYIPGIGSLTNMQAYRDLAKRFQEEHPEIVVDIQMLDIMGGTTPSMPELAQAADCFQWYPGFQEAETRDAILSLEPFLDADPDFDVGDYYGQALEEFKWQGELLGLPADITPFIMEYNKDLFEAAGVEAPAVGWTWEDFLAAAVALTEGEDKATKTYGFVGDVQELNDLLFMLERVGGRLIDDKADPPALSFDDPTTVEALRLWASLSTEHEVKPMYLADYRQLAGATSMFAEREALINEGRAAMWTNSAVTAGLFGERAELNVGAVPLPAKESIDIGAYTGASGHFISADTDNRLQCWQWITFLTGEPAAAQGLPARRSVAESETFTEQVGAERAAAYLASIADVERPSSFRILSEEEWLGGAIFWLGIAYDQVLKGDATPEEAMAAAQEMADDYRACVIAAGDFGSETWQGCVAEVDPSLPTFLYQTGE